LFCLNEKFMLKFLPMDAEEENIWCKNQFRPLRISLVDKSGLHRDRLEMERQYLTVVLTTGLITQPLCDNLCHT
jgi:hypothetical protein